MSLYPLAPRRISHCSDGEQSRIGKNIPNNIIVTTVRVYTVARSRSRFTRNMRGRDRSRHKFCRRGPRDNANVFYYSRDIIIIYIHCYFSIIHGRTYARNDRFWNARVYPSTRSGGKSTTIGLADDVPRWMKFIELAAVREYFHIVNGRGAMCEIKAIRVRK